jgi:hypothetical protein
LTILEQQTARSCVLSSKRAEKKYALNNFYTFNDEIVQNKARKTSASRRREGMEIFLYQRQPGIFLFQFLPTLHLYHSASQASSLANSKRYQKCV